MNDHVAGEGLAAYLDGALKGEAKARVEAHLSRCPECLEALAEIVEIQGSRVKIPGEFLQRALEAPGGEAPEGREAPARPALPMRLVLGAAAVFLVAVLLGYFFLGRGRLAAPVSERTDLAVSQPEASAPSRPDVARKETAGAEAGETKSTTAVGRAAAPQVLVEAPADVEAKKEHQEDDLGAGRPRQAAPPPAAAKEESLADEAAEAPRQEQEAGMEGGVEGGGEGGVGGGVLGGVEAAAEKDKAGGLKLAEQRSKGQAPLGKQSVRRAPSGQDAARSAVQVVLAVSGRAAAPLSLCLTPPSPGFRFRVAGDVSLADLRNPGLLDEWSWFPDGAALELAVAADGRVSAVSLLGRWDRLQAATARAEAGKLLFSASGAGQRRAVLSVSEAPPN